MPQDVSGHKVSVFVWEGSNLKETSFVPVSNVVSIPNGSLGMLNVTYKIASENISTTTSQNTVWEKLERLVAAQKDLESNNRLTSTQQDSMSELSVPSDPISISTKISKANLGSYIFFTADITVRNNQVVSQEVAPCMMVWTGTIPSDLSYKNRVLSPGETTTINLSTFLPSNISSKKIKFLDIL